MKGFHLTLLRLLTFIAVFFLYAIKPFKHIKLVLFTFERIGHLACNPDLFLRRLQLNIIRKKGILYVGLAITEPANKQLFKMLRRKLPIIQLPGIRAIAGPLMSGTSEIISKKKLILVRSPFYQELPFESNEYYEFNNTEPNLHFTESEEDEGKKLLNKMGIDDNSWFICFHSRDSVYWSNIEWGVNDYRNCDIKNYLEAAKYIASLGGFAVRMGYGVAEKLPDLNNPRTIDYASYYRTDFGDIYLPSKCKFFLGNTAGIFLVSTIFNVPVACANFISLEYTPLREGDLFIPKKIWSIKKKRFLTFREILESEVAHYGLSKHYIEAGLEVVENTAEEILDLAKEMNERLDGNFEDTEEDEEWQKGFHSLFQPHHRCYGSPARIGAKFLRQNKELLK